jgi:hypothetical protein
MRSTLRPRRRLQAPGESDATGRSDGLLAPSVKVLTATESSERVRRDATTTHQPRRLGSATPGSHRKGGRILGYRGLRGPMEGPAARAPRGCSPALARTAVPESSHLPVFLCDPLIAKRLGNALANLRDFIRLASSREIERLARWRPRAYHGRSLARLFQSSRRAVACVGRCFVRAFGVRRPPCRCATHR